MVLSVYSNAKYITVLVLNLALHQGRSIVTNLVRFVLSFFPSIIQRDSKRCTQFRTSVFPELYMVCEWST